MQSAIFPPPLGCAEMVMVGAELFAVPPVEPGVVRKQSMTSIL
jgi:hypothetical protein